MAALWTARIRSCFGECIRMSRLTLLHQEIPLSRIRTVNRQPKCRLCDQKGVIPNASKTKPSKYVKPVGRIRGFVFGKFVDYIESYERIFEKNFPKAFKVYQVFSIGIKEFYRDFTLFASLAVKLRQGNRFSELTRNEIEKYHAMPQEICRVAPVLLISALPFANYVIFPLAYMFPKQLLSSHFWSLQQRLEFVLQDHKHRLRQYRPVFRRLQAKVAIVSDPTVRQQCVQLGSGTHASLEEILELQNLFLNEPYGLQYLSFGHVSSLCKMYRLSTFGLRRRRLWYHAALIRQMDLAVLREGIEIMNLDELRYACFLRGINPVGMSTAEIVSWLSTWISITRQLRADNLSLLLHCPILLAYNSPTNWSLIH